MIQHEGNGLRIKPHIERIEHRAGHGNAIVQFQHFRDIRGKYGNRIPGFKAVAAQGGRKLAASPVKGAVGATQGAMNDGCFVGINFCCPFEKAHWRQGLIIRRVPVQIRFKWIIWHEVIFSTFIVFANVSRIG